MTGNKKKKRYKVLMLTKSKLNSIISQSSINITSTDWHGNISHEEFNTIMKEKKIWEDERKCEECK